MTSSLYKQACRLFPHQPYLTRKTVHHIRAQWIRKIKELGDNWILAKKIPRNNSNGVPNAHR